MATTVSTLITRIRLHLNETTAAFWSDSELLAHVQEGAADLWKALVGVNEDHFFTLSTASSVVANQTTLSAVPSDLYRVKLIEPTTLSTYVNTFFQPLDYANAKFRRARSMDAQDPVGQVFYYDLVNEGPPVSTASIYIAPKSNAAFNLQIGYVRTVSTLGTGSNNPIPGESDHALVAWTVAHARAKEREDRAPDPEWLAVYGTEKKNLVQVSTPRQVDELEAVDALFENYWES